MKYQFLFGALLFLFISCDATKRLAKTFDPSGTWDFVVTNTPIGDIDGTITMTKEGDGWTANMESSQGNVVMEDVIWIGKNMTSKFDYQGTPTTLNITVPAENNTTFTGSVSSSFGDFDLTGTKQEMP